MEKYKNLGGQSSVSQYEIGEDYITIEFVKKDDDDGSNTYKYTYESAGSHNIEKMKEIAMAGEGLTSFVNENVKKLYESKS
jgi:hypothetical protein